MSETCDAEAAGYDGMFGVYCDRPEGHEGLHCDGIIEWRDVRLKIGRYGKTLEERHDCGRANDGLIPVPSEAENGE